MLFYCSRSRLILLEETQSSGRRGFIRKLAGAGVLGVAASLLLGLKPAAADTNPNAPDGDIVYKTGVSTEGYEDDFYSDAFGSLHVAGNLYTTTPNPASGSVTGGRVATGTVEATNSIHTPYAYVGTSLTLGPYNGGQFLLDARSSVASSQMHVSSSDTDSGGYLTSANPGNLFMSAGAWWSGLHWFATNSSAYIYGGGPAGVRFFFDTGLTSGNAYTPTTRMFIGPTGHVGIGMSTAPAHLLQLGLDDAAKPSTSTWTIASDGRLKDPESIEPFTEGSDLIRRLPQPVWFRYKKDSGLPSDRRVAGWIAQDVASVAPFMVRRTKQKLSVDDFDETETLSLNTNELPYALVNFAKEMLTQMIVKEREITELQVEVNSLKEIVNSLRRETDSAGRPAAAA
jgi:hypothetical protein